MREEAGDLPCRKRRRPREIARRVRRGFPVTKEMEDQQPELPRE